MRIEGIAFLPASQPMSNEDVLDKIRENSQDRFDGDLDQALRYINWMMEGTQLKNRYWFAEDERPLDLMVSAARKAMAQAGCKPGDIDLLIYTGNGRGFTEPGDSHFIAHALGRDDIDCFDVVDACMGWTRSCDLVQSHFRCGRYRRAMIINAESFFVPGGPMYPSNFQLTSLRDIAFCFSPYCAGDGASATILVPDPDNHWSFDYLASKHNVDLCSIPLTGYEKRSTPTPKMGLNGVGALTSFSSQVFNTAGQYMIDSIKLLEPHRATLKMVFPHTGGSVPEYMKWADAAGLAQLLRFIYPQYGNIGSMSIPAGIALHAESGELQRGDQVGYWIGSAGMSFVAATLRY